jgi:hypothetical protein
LKEVAPQARPQNVPKTYQLFGARNLKPLAESCRKVLGNFLELRAFNLHIAVVLDIVPAFLWGV